MLLFHHPSFPYLSLHHRIYSHHPCHLIPRQHRHHLSTNAIITINANVVCTNTINVEMATQQEHQNQNPYSYYYQLTNRKRNYKYQTIIDSIFALMSLHLILLMNVHLIQLAFYFHFSHCCRFLNSVPNNILPKMVDT